VIGAVGNEEGVMEKTKGAEFSEEDHGPKLVLMLQLCFAEVLKYRMRRVD
jgi:hypothetical protein